MARKGKRELIIEVRSGQFTIVDFKKALDKRLKELGVKYSEDIKMYFNDGIVYCVDTSGKQYKIEI